MNSLMDRGRRQCPKGRCITRPVVAACCRDFERGATLGIPGIQLRAIGFQTIACGFPFSTCDVKMPRSCGNRYSMVIHSGSLIQLFAWLLTLGALIGLLVSVVLLIARKYRVAAKVLAISLAAVGVYAVAATAISSLAPQKIIKLGDSYCWDSWCMGIERVNSTSRGREVEYKVDAHIF